MTNLSSNAGTQHIHSTRDSYGDSVDSYVYIDSDSKKQMHRQLSIQISGFYTRIVVEQLQSAVRYVNLQGRGSAQSF